jgi:MFS family permease
LQATTQQVKTPVILAILVCGLASLFYLYEFTLQVSPAVMTHELMSAFAINASGLGAISAFYYYAYTPMQLPAGMLFDRFGPRKLLSFAILICVAGALLFGATHSIAVASLGRFLMGVGSAFSFIGALLLISRWFPAKYFALLAGITQLMSSLGAIAGTAPLAAAVQHFGWRHSIITIGIFGIVLAVLFWLVVRDHPPGHPAREGYSEKASLKGLREVLSKVQTWHVALFSFASWGPILVFAGLWGIAYISALYNISTLLAATPMMMVWIGIGIGSPLVGWWSDHIGSRNIPLITVQIIGLIAAVCILYVPVPFAAMYVLLFLMGIAASAQALSFGIVKDINHPRTVGTAIGFNNMAVVAGGAILQPLAGILLKHYWTGTTLAGVPTYTAHAYQNAMFIVPILYVVCIIMAWRFIRETHCKDSHLTEESTQHETSNTISRFETSPSN